LNSRLGGWGSIIDTLLHLHLLKHKATALHFFSHSSTLYTFQSFRMQVMSFWRVTVFLIPLTMLS
jgi:hypothetical protein